MLLEVRADGALGHPDLLIALGHGAQCLLEDLDEGRQRRAEVARLAVIQGVGRHLVGQAALGILDREWTCRRIGCRIEQHPIACRRHGHGAAQRLVLEQGLEGGRDLRRSSRALGDRLGHEIGQVVRHEEEPVGGERVGQAGHLRHLGQRAGPGGVGIERRGDRVGIRPDDELVIGQRVRARLEPSAAWIVTPACSVEVKVRPASPASARRRPMPASAAAASVTPSRKTVGGTSGTAIGSTGICIADAGRSVTATATCPSNQGIDVVGPADAGALGGEHLVDPLHHLRVEGLSEVDALDRRESPEQLAQRRVLIGRWLEPQLDVEGRVGGDVGGAGANGSRARVQQEASGCEADPDGEDAQRHR